MTAMLGMYDRPETRAANDRLWSGVRHELGFGPRELDRSRSFHDIWTDPDLILAQTCGMPFRLGLHRSVQLVATPDYGLPDCPAGFYFSVLVTHKDNAASTLAELCKGTFAYNEAQSQSGWAAPILHLVSMGLKPASRLQTEAHYLSARAVAEKKAALAGLDAFTWELIRRYDDFASDIHVMARTKPTPTLPYITGPKQNPAQIRTALSRAIAALDSTDRATLGLQGLIQIPASAYLSVASPPPPEAL